MTDNSRPPRDANRRPSMPRRALKTAPFGIALLMIWAFVAWAVFAGPINDRDGTAAPAAFVLGLVFSIPCVDGIRMMWSGKRSILDREPVDTDRLPR